MSNRRMARLAGSLWLIGIAMDPLAYFRMVGTATPASLPVMGRPVRRVSPTLRGPPLNPFDALGA